MLILAIRTDKPQAEVGFFAHGKTLTHETWQAHRKLAETIHQQIATLLQSVRKEWSDVKGIVVYQGPGSFTGLRIGLSVANGLAYGLSIPVVATTGSDWVTDGIKRLERGESDKVAVPAYGSPVHITQQKK